MNAAESNLGEHAHSKSSAICILGMHRSGTSTITRAINLLGVYLGEDAKMRGCGPDNPQGFWEHPEICDLQSRLLARLGRTWDTAAPLPERWLQSDAIRPFKDELARLVAANFAGHSLWAWKEPRTCLLLPLWREALEKTGTKLSCLFVVRSPVDVASSLFRRDAVPFNKALGIWFHYNIVALKDAAGLPVVFVSYDRLLASWEPELRRCAAMLGLDWPADEQRFQEAMNSFIQPGLRHNQSPPARLQELPHPVQELYQVLLEASVRSTPRDDRFDGTVSRLSKDFHAYATFFQNGLNTSAPGKLERLWRRWQRSFRKRFPVQLAKCPPQKISYLK